MTTALSASPKALRKHYGVIAMAASVVVFLVTSAIKERSVWYEVGKMCGDGERIQGVMYLSNPDLPLGPGDMCFIAVDTGPAIKVASYRLGIARDWTLEDVTVHANGTPHDRD